jgi:hypothetical protein
VPLDTCAISAMSFMVMSPCRLQIDKSVALPETP